MAEKNAAPACPICKRPMEPFEGFWKCAHGTQFNDLFRPDRRPGRWRVARGLLWSLVGKRVRNRRAERAARAARAKRAAA